DGSYHELYNIVADPYEKTDLKEVKKDTVTDLVQLLADWKKTLPAKPMGKVFSNLRIEKN
ncbi:MAG: N-acetylgalactosamine-6-sulfatase, partial [Verrucomicrobiales bacterium]